MTEIDFSKIDGFKIKINVSKGNKNTLSSSLLSLNLHVVQASMSTVAHIRVFHNKIRLT